MEKGQKIPRINIAISNGNEIDVKFSNAESLTISTISRVQKALVSGLRMVHTEARRKQTAKEKENQNG